MVFGLCQADLFVCRCLAKEILRKICNIPRAVCFVFEQNLIDYVPDSFEAMKASRLIGNSFTIYARTQNERTMTEEEKKQYDFIEPYENYPTFWFGTYQYLYNNTK